MLSVGGTWVVLDLSGFGVRALCTPATVAAVVLPIGAAEVLRQRAEQIKRAGAGLGWVMQDVYPGLIRGTLNVRSHQAVVDVPYTQTTFSVRYASSNNLDYSGSGIHKNYNSWVKNLEQRITAESAV